MGVMVCGGKQGAEGNSSPLQAAPTAPVSGDLTQGNSVLVFAVFQLMQSIDHKISMGVVEKSA